MVGSVNVSARPATAWGVNLQAAMYADVNERERQLSRLADRGVTIARIGIRWAWTESEEGQLIWDAADSLITALERFGIRPLVEVTSMPAWARPAGTPETFGPSTAEQISGYADYCGHLASRFKGRIYAYEIWNEANGSSWYPEPNLEDYSSLFVAAYKSIKAQDSTVPVITTGMAGNDGYIDAIPWTEQFLKTDAMRLADGFGFHPYSNGDGRVSGMLLTAVNIRQMLDGAGFSLVPMYMTETGIATGGRGGVSEQMQANIVDLTSNWITTIRGVNCVLWYCDMDSADRQARDASDPEGYFGLWHADGTEKPAVANFAAKTGQIQEAGSVPASWWAVSGATCVGLNEVAAD